MSNRLVNSDANAPLTCPGLWAELETGVPHRMGEPSVWDLAAAFGYLGRRDPRVWEVVCCRVLKEFLTCNRPRALATFQGLGQVAWDRLRLEYATGSGAPLSVVGEEFARRVQQLTITPVLGRRPGRSPHYYHLYRLYHWARKALEFTWDPRRRRYGDDGIPKLLFVWKGDLHQRENDTRVASQFRKPLCKPCQTAGREFPMEVFKSHTSVSRPVEPPERLARLLVGETFGGLDEEVVKTECLKGKRWEESGLREKSKEFLEGASKYLEQRLRLVGRRHAGEAQEEVDLWLDS